MKRSINVGFLIAFTAIAFYTSCNKLDVTDIGNDLIPAVDNVTTFDTVLDALVTNNYLMDDSTIIGSTEDQALGWISNDPAMGTSSGSVYAYFQPSKFGLYPFSDSIVGLDSVVLSLASNYTYGDTNSTIRINVYEIDQNERTFFKDSLDPHTLRYGYHVSNRYFETSSLLTTHDQLVSKINDADSVLEGAILTGIKNQIRIHFDNSFGNRFLNYDTTVYKTDSSFRDNFLGLALIPDTSFGASNALAYISLKDTSTRLSFYYHSIQNGKDTALVTTFTVASNSTANIIRQNHSGSELEAAVANGTPDDKLYIQASPGSYARIDVPGLASISNRVVHRAELIFDRVDAPQDNIFSPPPVLFLDAIDTTHNGVRTIQNDFTTTTGSSLQYNVSLFGGIYKNNQYVFNLSRYVQGIITRHEESFPLRVYAPYDTYTIYIPPGLQSQIQYDSLKKYQLNPFTGFSFHVLPDVAAGRVVLGGGSYADLNRRARLRIIYSKL